MYCYSLHVGATRHTTNQREVEVNEDNDGVIRAITADELTRMLLPQKVGGRIVLLRVMRGWTQQYLAERLGVARGAIGGWETGKYEPSRANRARLGLLFGVSPELFRVEEKVPNPDE
jgi:DNA-binding XRE family transcriptional regulator